MVAPTNFDLTIYVNDVDVTAYVPSDTLAFTDNARQVSTFDFTIQNPSGVTPARGHEVRITANSLADAPVFTGYIMELVTKKRDNGITKEYEVRCADRKILLQKSVIGDNVFTGSDFDILGDLLANTYPDLSSYFDFETDVTSFADGLEFAIPDGTSLLDALSDLADMTGAEISFDTATEGGVVEELVGTIDFDGGYADYTETAFGFTASVQSGGNPDLAYIGAKTNPANGDYIEVQFDLLAPIFITDWAFDWQTIVPGGVISGDFRLLVYYDGVRVLSSSAAPSASWVTRQHSVDSPAQDICKTVVNSSIAIRIVVEDASPTAGDWSFGLDNIKVWAVTADDTIDFDGGASYTVINTGATLAGETAVGNPGNGYEFDFTNSGQVVEIQHDLGAEQTVAGVGVHVKIDGTIGNAIIRLLDADSVEVATNTLTALATTASVTWNYRGVEFDPPVSAQFIRVRYASVLGSNVQVNTDNIAWYSGIAGNPLTALNWDEDPPAADFDIDIQLGDEFAFDIDLFEGDFGDFNSVTVIGGYEEVAVDWTYAMDGGQDHLGLELPITALVVYKNTGTDVTPVWGSALALGSWGSDTLTGAGGTKDVLYDANDHWLYFDTEPANLVYSVRITGTIRRPIRVRVESVAEGDLTLATSYTDEKITSVDEAVAIGQAQLEQNNSIKRLNFSTHEPGLKAGQAINVVDSARGLDETLVIQSINVKWMGPVATFDVECGEAEAVSLDAMIANTDKRSRQIASNVSPDTQTAVLVTDDSGVFMTDDSGSQLYYIA
jgi:hypothetical protein